MSERVSRTVPPELFYVALYDAECDPLADDFLVDPGKRFPPQTMPVHAEWRAILEGGTPRLIHLTPRDLAAPDPLPRIGEVNRRGAPMLFLPVLRGQQVIGVGSGARLPLKPHTPPDNP